MKVSFQTDTYAKQWHILTARTSRIHNTLTARPSRIHNTLTARPSRIHNTLTARPSRNHNTLTARPSTIHNTLTARPSKIHVLISTETNTRTRNDIIRLEMSALVQSDGIHTDTRTRMNRTHAHVSTVCHFRMHALLQSDSIHTNTHTHTHRSRLIVCAPGMHAGTRTLFACAR
jgi:hypothetical protein